MPDTDLNTAADPSMDQAAPDTGQDAAPVTSGDGGQAQAASSDDGLLLGRYKSVDDLAAAYTNLQAEYTRLKQERQQQVPPQPLANPYQGVDPAKLQEAFYYAWEQNPMAVIQNVAKNVVQQALTPVAGQLAQLKREEQIRNLAINHADDIKDVAQYMAPILQGAPQLWDMPNGLELAYQAAKSQWLENQANTRANNIAQQQMADTVRSQAVGTGGVQPTPQPDAEDLLRSAIRQGGLPE